MAIRCRAQPQGAFSLDRTAHFPRRANEHLQPCSERNRATRASPRSRAARVVPSAPHSHQPSGSSPAPCSPSLTRARGFFYILNVPDQARGARPGSMPQDTRRPPSPAYGVRHDRPTAVGCIDVSPRTGQRCLRARAPVDVHNARNPHGLVLLPGKGGSENYRVEFDQCRFVSFQP